ARDVGGGPAGPARFRRGPRGPAVGALEPHAGRPAGAARPTRLVKQGGVTVVRADAPTLPFKAAVFDACLSQEALLHIADKPAVLGECRRGLVRGGRPASTDWVALPRPPPPRRPRLWERMTATPPPTPASYRSP